MSAWQRGGTVLLAGVLGWALLALANRPDVLADDGAALVLAGSQALRAALLLAPVLIAAEAAARIVRPHRSRATMVAALTCGLIAGLVLDPFARSDVWPAVIAARAFCAAGLPLLWWRMLPLAPAERARA